MRLRGRLLLVAAVGGTAALVAHLAAGDRSHDALILLGAGIVLGEILVMRLEDGTGLPLSYSVHLVVVASFPLASAAVTIVAAQAVAALLRPHARSAAWRLAGWGHRILVAGLAWVAFHLAGGPLERRPTMWALVGALFAAAVAETLGDEVARRLLRYRSGLTGRGRLAWIALASSGALMAIGYRGVEGGEAAGIWGPFLFALPLLAAWYAFDRLEHISRTYEQTLAALAVAPEYAGLAAPGHARRVADLAVAMGRDLGLSGRSIYDLEKAALLHHLGEVTFEAPEVAGPADPADVAAVTGDLLQSVADLVGAGAIVRGQGGRSREAGSEAGPAILQAASAFDELTGGDTERTSAAIAAISSAPGYVYDRRVLDSLERVTTGRGD